ncbi:MAG: PTS sugar transporter subunit IIA [Planctomycetota bacterium]|jgi:PTS system fructose-specific IIA component/PTS system nitrogen regulatory IIA component
MRLCEFLVKGALVHDLKAGTKEEAIRALVGKLVEAGKVQGQDADDISRAIMKRESLGSTAIGHGVAIPHARHVSVQSLIGTVGVVPAGMPFESKDGKPVFVLVLIVSPHDRPGDHLRALENVSSALRDLTFVENLKAATKHEELSELLFGAGGK